MTSIDTSTDPVLTLAMTLRIECTPFEAVGPTGKGIRRISNLTKGTFEIPAQNAGTFETKLTRGVVLGGHDWQLLHGETLAELDARYNLRTEDGHLIYVRAAGRRYGTPEVLQKLMRGESVVRGKDYYGASAPLIETAAPGLEWMNHHAFIGNSRSEPGVQSLRFFAVTYKGA